MENDSLFENAQNFVAEHGTGEFPAGNVAFHHERISIFPVCHKFLGRALSLCKEGNAGAVGFGDWLQNGCPLGDNWMFAERGQIATFFVENHGRRNCKNVGNQFNVG